MLTSLRLTPPEHSNRPRGSLAAGWVLAPLLSLAWGAGCGPATPEAPFSLHVYSPSLAASAVEVTPMIELSSICSKGQRWNTAFLSDHLELVDLRTGARVPVAVTATPGSYRIAALALPRRPLEEGHDYGLRLRPNELCFGPNGGEKLTQFFVGSRPRVVALRGEVVPWGRGISRDVALFVHFSEPMVHQTFAGGTRASLTDLQTGQLIGLEPMEKLRGEEPLMLPLGDPRRYDLGHAHLLRLSRRGRSTKGAYLDGKLTWPAPEEDFELEIPAADFARIFASTISFLSYACDGQSWLTREGPVALHPRCHFDSH